MADSDNGKKKSIIFRIFKTAAATFVLFFVTGSFLYADSVEYISRQEQMMASREADMLIDDLLDLLFDWYGLLPDDDDDDWYFMDDDYYDGYDCDDYDPDDFYGYDDWDWDDYDCDDEGWAGYDWDDLIDDVFDDIFDWDDDDEYAYDDDDDDDYYAYDDDDDYYGYDDDDDWSPTKPDSKKKKDDKKNIRKWAKTAIRKLNRANKKLDHSLIETQERDELFQFFFDAGCYVGVDIFDVVDETRDW